MGADAGRYEPFACFACRKSFKRPIERNVLERPCPCCGRPALIMALKFKAPPSRDRRQWEKVRILRENGFLFRSLYDQDGKRIAYPARLSEVADFLREFGRQYRDQVLSNPMIVPTLRRRER